MPPLDLPHGPHRRLDLLTGEQVLVSPHRADRPWKGEVEPSRATERPAHDPDCALCPGGRRAGGAVTPHYDGTFVFDNDFPALLPTTEDRAGDPDGLLRAVPERGLCRVVCWSPRHDLTLARLPHADVRRVVDTWTEQYVDLGRLDWVRHVQVFENRGAAMGASNPHPHGQVWADEHLPVLPAKELARQRAHADRGSCLLCDYAAVERQHGDRVVLDEDGWLVVVPFWAAWPFETLVLPRRHHGGLTELDDDERDGLAHVLGRLARRYDALFDAEFPYSMGLHAAPTDGDRHPEWHLHAHFFPPLLRSATVRKFMVGYELLAQPQRDLTPEAAAQRLRATGER